MNQSNVIVRILTEWKGSQNLKKGQSDLNAFEASALRVGKAIGAAFAIEKVAQFGNASLKAFTADNLAAKQLANTLTNLGLAFDTKRVESFIQATEKATGVLDDQLRPAMQLFLNTTGSVNKSQDLLNTSLNISRATGKDLQSVSTALSRAYLGNYTALQRLGIGIDTASLKSMNFAQAQDLLNKKFGGAAKLAADSYQGSLDKLKVAADNAKEAIGKGMVDALSAFSKSGSIDATVNAIDRVSSAIGRLIGGTGRFIAFTKDVFLGGQSAVDAAASIYGVPGASKPQTRGAGRLAVDVANARAAAEKKVADQLAAQAKAAKATFDSSKAQLALKKQQATFDQQAIEIAAALKNDKLTADEKLRLQMLSTADQLQAAIQDQNQVTTDNLTKALTELQTAFANLAKTNPFDTATQGAIALQSALYGLNAQLQATRSTNPLGGGYDLSNYAGGVPSLPSAPSMGGGTTTVNLTLDGQIVQQVIVDNTASGSPSTYARNLGSPLRDSW